MSDYHWCNPSSTDLRLLLVGGFADHGGSAGLGCFSSHLGVGLSIAHCGFRALKKIWLYNRFYLHIIGSISYPLLVESCWDTKISYSMSVVTLIMAVTLVSAISILTTALAYLTLIVGLQKF